MHLFEIQERLTLGWRFDLINKRGTYNVCCEDLFFLEGKLDILFQQWCAQQEAKGMEHPFLVLRRGGLVTRVVGGGRGVEGCVREISTSSEAAVSIVAPPGTRIVSEGSTRELRINRTARIFLLGEGSGLTIIREGLVRDESWWSEATVAWDGAFLRFQRTRWEQPDPHMSTSAFFADPTVGEPPTEIDTSMETQDPAHSEASTTPAQMGAVN